MRICFLDLETTGLRQTEGHRIVEMAFVLFSYDQETGEKHPIGKYVQRVNPMRPIDAKAFAVHKISADSLAKEPVWGDVVGKAVKVLSGCDLVVCHNVNFDIPFITGEIRRVGEIFPSIETFCTMNKGRFATFNGSVPSLKNLCRCFDLEYDDAKAHAALYDVTLTAHCFFLGLEKGQYSLSK